jgi:hypothetical protein
LQILDNKTSSLILFEVVQQIRKEVPFTSQEEANARLRVLLFALQKFEVRNEGNRKFLEGLIALMRNKVYESEAFDEHLDFKEYIVLREITIRLNQIKGGNDEALENQI